MVFWYKSEGMVSFREKEPPLVVMSLPYGVPSLKLAAPAMLLSMSAPQPPIHFKDKIFSF